MPAPTIAQCDDYLDSRTGRYEWRAVRYRAAADWMIQQGLDHSMTVTDLGAGMTEFDYCLRAEFRWRGRYIPVDAGIDGTDLNHWRPMRKSSFYVGLEIIEHLPRWEQLVRTLQAAKPRGIVLSTPNPETTDVFGMDPTHVREVWPAELEKLGFTVSRETFYGGAFSAGEPDSLLATWVPQN